MTKPKISPRLNSSIRRKMLLLLNMEYKPIELAAELGIARQTVAFYLGFGLPCRKDEKGHIWINGKDFEAWAKSIMSTYEKPHNFGELDFYCLSCRGAVKVETYTRRNTGRADILKATCPKCKNNMHKFARSK